MTRADQSEVSVCHSSLGGSISHRASDGLYSGREEEEEEEEGADSCFTVSLFNLFTVPGLQPVPAAHISLSPLCFITH